MLARLLPDGYRDDPDAAGEFRKSTESSLRSAKQQAAQEMLDTLPEAGGRIQLTHDQAHAWLKALNDVRLALGVRLNVTEEFEQQWGRLARRRSAVGRVRGLRLARRGAGVTGPGTSLSSAGSGGDSPPSPVSYAIMLAVPPELVRPDRGPRSR